MLNKKICVTFLFFFYIPPLILRVGPLRKRQGVQMSKRGGRGLYYYHLAHCLITPEGAKILVQGEGDNVLYYYLTLSYHTKRGDNRSTGDNENFYVTQLMTPGAITGFQGGGGCIWLENKGLGGRGMQPGTKEVLGREDNETLLRSLSYNNPVKGYNEDVWTPRPLLFLHSLLSDNKQL